MADEADTGAEQTGLPPLRLHANSYDVHDLLKAAKHAEGLKREDNQEAALSAIADNVAANQDVLAGLNAPAIPEGTTLQEVEDAQGRTVLAPVQTPADNEPTKDSPPTDEPPADPPPATTSRRKAAADSNTADA